MKTTARIAIALFSITLSLAACKGEGDKDWATVPLTSQTATIAGVSVTWKVPEGLTKDEALSNDKRVSMKTSKPGDPSVSLKVGSIPTKLAGAVDSAGFLFGKGAETLEQTERDGGFVVVLANDKKSKLMVAHYMKKGSAELECVVSHMSSDPIPNVDAAVARFHEICDSVTVQ